MLRINERQSSAMHGDLMGPRGLISVSPVAYALLSGYIRGALSEEIKLSMVEIQESLTRTVREVPLAGNGMLSSLIGAVDVTSVIDVT